ncbi:MAG TPA: electron transfer flavoprotein subunit beta/FixA family protein [Dehalococcoidales bacterium]|nr:electron transfer flavoprotein subunit beta/FixA family protein [Dehalococcoidales bacterium]
MHIVCCVKQVPDTAQVKIDPHTNTLVRSGVESIGNPYDLVAVEAAVRLTEKHGGQVTVVSMGPPQADAALRECLALGAKQAFLLADRAFAGADTLATGYTLARAIEKIAAAEPVDLVMCGKQAIDGDTAQTGPGTATRLGYTLFTYVSEIISLDPEKKIIRVRREVEGGSEIIEGRLPALLTVELTLAVPRYASLPELLRSLRHEIKTWGAADLDIAPERLGLKGSPTSVKEIFAPPVRTGGPVFDISGDKGKAVTDFLDAFFKQEGKLLEELPLKDKG